MYKQLIGLSVAIAMTSAAFAHGGATGIVKQRMDEMGAMSKSIKAIAPMIKGTAPYDAETVRNNAKILQQHAGEHMVSLFPQGSDQAPTDAKPNVWEEQEAFGAIATKLQHYAVALESSADNPPQKLDKSQLPSFEGPVVSVDALAEKSVSVSFGLVAKSCSTCHTKFRR